MKKNNEFYTSSNHLWCKTTSGVKINSEKFRKLVVERFNKFPIKTLEYLGHVTSGKLNVDFVINFWDIFQVDNDCTCDTFHRGKGQYKISEDPHDKGYSGIVWLIADSNNNQAILKRTIKSISHNSVNFYMVKTNDMVIQVNPINTGMKILDSAMSKRMIPVVGMGDFETQSVLSLFIGIIIDRHAKNKPRLRGSFARQYDAFVCDKKGYAFLELSNAGNLSDFIRSFEGTDKELDYALCVALHDILSVLAVLKSPNYGFCHNDLRPENIFVHDTRGKTKGSTTGLPSSGNPDKYPFVFRIADFDKSSISYNGIRFHNMGDAIMRRMFSNADIFGKTVIEPDTQKESYILGDKTSKFISIFYDKINGPKFHGQMMFSPYATYITYDIYLMVLCLLLISKVNHMGRDNFDGVKKYKFFDIIRKMFTPSDYKILFDITNFGDNDGNITDAINLMVNNKLYLFTDLSEIFNDLGVKPLGSGVPDSSSKSIIEPESFTVNLKD